MKFTRRTEWELGTDVQFYYVTNVVSKVPAGVNREMKEREASGFRDETWCPDETQSPHSKSAPEEIKLYSRKHKSVFFFY